MKRPFILLLGLLLISSVVALEIETDYNSNILVPEANTSIDLTLKITNASFGTYNVFTLSDISVNPTDRFEITDSEFEKTFTLTPNDNLDVEGFYTFTYTLNQREVEKFDNKFTVNILKLEDVLEISSDEISSDSNEIRFYVENKESVELKGLIATFESLVFETSESFDLKPLEKKYFTVIADGSKLRKTKAGVYVIESTFETNKGTSKIDGTLFLGEKKGITTNEDTAGFLITTETITKLNSGNVFESVEITTSRNILTRLFTTFNSEPTITDRSGFVVKYTWVKERLGPAEVMTIKAKTNYLLPILIIIFASLALWALRRFSESKVLITKSVRPVRTKGGEFALRISLNVKAVKSVENLTLIDKIPHMVKIYKKFGSVEPDKIDPHSRRVHWNIGDLNPGEERALSYIVYSKIGVVGRFQLPRALAVFERDENVHEVESNSVFFMNEQSKGD